MVFEAIKTSGIEGEIINKMDVISSFRKNPGLLRSLEPKGQNVNGLSQMLIDVRSFYKEVLTESKKLVMK